MTEPAPHSANPDTPGALRVGTRLGEFELRSVIGVGGFGIVYLAFDHALEREIAIKEYMPGSLATRGGSAQVMPLSQSVTENFEAGLRSFVSEGRMLAHFDSPSLLKVHRFWEANGTAYIAMPLYRGRTLKEHRAAMPAPPDETAARALLMPLLAAVDLLHRESIFHRDIAPDNILVEAGNRPVLLDFGAARRVIGEKSQALTAILKPAYAPIEQYGEAASVKQGAWTDLYALGATMHYLLLGQAPPPSTTRAVQDEMQPLAGRELPGCSKRFLQAIDWMLAPRPADRPQSVSALVDVLEGRAEVPARGGAPDGSAGTASRNVAVGGAAASAAATTGAAAPTAAEWQTTQRAPPAMAPPEPRGAMPVPAQAGTDSDAVDIPIDQPASAAPEPRAAPATQRASATAAAPAAGAPRAAAAPPSMVPASGSVVQPTNALARFGLPVLLLALLIGAAAWWFRPKPAPAPSIERIAPVTGSTPAAPPAGEPAAPLPANAVVPQPVAPAAAPASSIAAPVPSQPPPARAPAEASVQPAPESPAALATPPAAAPPPKPAVAAARPADAARPAATPASARRPKPTGSGVATIDPPRPDTKASPTTAPAAQTVPAAQAQAPQGTEAAGLAAAPAAKAAKAAKGPREQCGRRVFLALVNCMNRECAKSENRKLEECSLYRPPD